jgi:hypothetical protein
MWSEKFVIVFLEHEENVKTSSKDFWEYACEYKLCPQHQSGPSLIGFAKFY